MAKSIKSCTDIPKITECGAEECSYNMKKNCHAVAITVGNSMSARCDTYFHRSAKGGVRGLNGGVGACKMESCQFNTELECCSDSGIQVSSKAGQATCITFSQT